VDGIVVKVNRRDWQEALGYTGKSPRFAVAFKFPAKQVATKIEDIQVQVGRTGVLTPVAHLRPVQLAGSIVSRATLHNQEEIKRLDARVGDTVIIQKAGDIIPDVINVIKELRVGKEKVFKMPKKCPMCNAPVIYKKDSPIARCSNKQCADRHRRSLYYFVSKNAFGIDGMGPKIINVLLDNGLIQDSADIFDLKQGDLTPLERFAEKSAENLIKAIDQCRQIGLDRFIVSLSILNVGERTARDLAEKFGSIDNLKNVVIEELEAVENIGVVTAKSVYDWFRDENNKKFLNKLLERIKIKKEKKTAGAKLKNIKFVLTGLLKSMPRQKVKEKIRLLGGEVSESVSKKTNFVVAGDEYGSKYEKAKKLGVKIISEQEFLKMIK
jgi:DNA ligase (NAD+)